MSCVDAGREEPVRQAEKGGDCRRGLRGRTQETGERTGFLETADAPFTATGPRQTAGLDMHKSVCAEVGSRLGWFSSFFLRALLHLINLKLSGQLPSSRDPAVTGVDRVLITSPA